MDQQHVNRVAFWVVSFFVIICLFVSGFHVAHAMAWIAPPAWGVAMAVAVVGMNLGFVGLRVLHPGNEGRHWLYLGIAVAATAELAANFLVGGLYSMRQVPSELGTFTGAEEQSLQRAVAVVFGLAAPILAAIGTGYLAESAKKVFVAPPDPPLSEFAMEVLRQRDQTRA